MEYQKVRDGTRYPGWLAAAQRRRLTWDGVRDTVDEVCDFRYPTPRLTARTGADHGWYRPLGPGNPAPRIHLTSPDGLYSLGVVLHELAHHAHQCQQPQVAEAGTTAERRRLWHGPEFTRILDGLLKAHYDH